MDERTARVLAERARMLAQPLRQRGGAAREIPFLLFAVGGSGFALPLTGAAMVRAIGDPEPVTGGPPWLLGLSSIAGRTMPVIGMTGFLAAGAQSTMHDGQAGRLVIVIEADGLDAALVADTLDGIEQLPTDAAALPAGTSSRVTAVSSGLCGNRLALDPKRLLHELREAFEGTVATASSRRARLPAAGPQLSEVA